MSFAERRRSSRHVINRIAKLQFTGGMPSRDCVVTDISDGGVRLYIEGIDVPDEFVLLLSDGEGNTRPRECRVVWRLGFELGAEFLDRPGGRGKLKEFAAA
jgi:hypothetical protein